VVTPWAHNSPFYSILTEIASACFSFDMHPQHVLYNIQATAHQRDGMVDLVVFAVNTFRQWVQPQEFAHNCFTANDITSAVAFWFFAATDVCVGGTKHNQEKN